MNEQIKHKPFVTTMKKKENLIKLANYLMALPDDYENFHMAKFCAPDIGSSPHHYKPEEAVNVIKCGAIACAVGHAPNAGIGVRSKLGDWSEFSTKYLIHCDSNEWEWCFGPEWEETDNTPKGAALRINYLLEKGLPENWADLYYSYGSEPLCYRAGEA